MALDKAQEGKTGDAKPSITYMIEIRDNGKQGGSDYPLEIRVKPSTQIYKVLLAWANKFALTVDDWVFTFDGTQIRLKDDQSLPTKQTVAELEIDEDVMIEAYRHQVGGSA